MKELLIALMATLMSFVVYGIIKYKPVGHDNTLRLSVISLAVFGGIILCLIDSSHDIAITFVGILGSLIGYAFGTFNKSHDNNNGNNEEPKK